MTPLPLTKLTRCDKPFVPFYFEIVAEEPAFLVTKMQEEKFIYFK
jgi:hypothetical protein